MNTSKKTAITAGILVAGSLAVATAAQKPNVIIILTDDQGYADMSCHGHPLLKTPNIDKLHDQSVRFTDFHAAPMSTPTRGQLLTGRDAMANGATAVCQGRSLLRADLPTMADMFLAAGYRTAHFGKWHLGDSYPYRPQDRGFEVTMYHAAWGITSLADYYDNTYWNATFLNQEGQWNKTEGYCTDTWFDLTLDFIGQREKDGQSFFLYLPLNCAHAPHMVDDNYVMPYRQALDDKDSTLIHFWGQVANIDENLGRLLEQLDKSGMRENTILVFMTDNGSAVGWQYYNAGMRGHKTQVWEGGHRVSFFISWPGGSLGYPRDISQLTHVQDVLPTLLELCGVAPEGSGFDGVSLAPLIRGQQADLNDRMLVIDYGANRSENKSLVMWNKWRYLNFNQGLYNIASDPRQDFNVAEQYPEIAAQMKAHYEAWWQKTRPEFELVRYIHIGNQRSNPMMLFANDWAGSYADNPGNLQNLRGRFGHWPVEVDADGTYVITLSRWSPEANVPISGYYAVKYPESAALKEITGARIKVGDAVKNVAVKASDVSASFTIKLKKGRTDLQTWFLDANGSEVCGAPFVKVHRIR